MNAAPSPDRRSASIDLSRKRERCRKRSRSKLAASLPLPFTGEVGNAPAFPGEGACRSHYFNVFKALNFFSPTLFPLLNSFLYRSDGPDHAHAPRFPRHRSGASARAAASTGGRGWRESAKTDEQFCCRSQARRRAHRQSQCVAPSSPFRGVSRETQSRSRSTPGASTDARSRPGAWQTDARNRANTQCAARSLDAAHGSPSPDSRFASVDLSRKRERSGASLPFTPRKRERFGVPLPFTGEVGNAPAFPGEGIPGHGEGLSA